MDNVMATPDLKTLAELAETLGLDALYKLDPDAFASAFQRGRWLKKSCTTASGFFRRACPYRNLRPEEIVMSALSYLSWVDAATQIREGKLSSKDYLESQLARIESLNPSLNAFLHVDAKGALERAEKADQVVKRSGRWTHARRSICA